MRFISAFLISAVLFSFTLYIFGSFGGAGSLASVQDQDDDAYILAPYETENDADAPMLVKSETSGSTEALKSINEFQADRFGRGRVST
jgi:hypothetical protein